MSYCVNCGVELEASLKECPLCRTPVINPNELYQNGAQARSPFPEKKAPVEAVKRKDLGLFITIVLLATAVTCGVLNWLVFTDKLWSVTIIGACVLLWVILVPVVIYTRQSVYVSHLFNGIAVSIYLYLLTWLTSGSEWFFGLGLPIVALSTVLLEVYTLCVRLLPKSFLTVALYTVTAIGILCLGLEILIDRYLTGVTALRWSAVVATICVIVDIALGTILSRRRLRNELRRRLHF